MNKNKVTAIISALLVACTVSSCNKKNEDNDKNVPQKSSLSELSVTTDGAKKTFNKISNITASEDMRILVPNNINEIYSYTSHPINDINMINMKDYYDDFMVLFQYLFPNHKINEEYWFYFGGSSKIEYDDEGNKIQDYNKVKDYYNEIISGSEGRVGFLYDETWYRDLTEWNDPVCLEIGNPMGYGYTTISKGKTVALNDLKILDIFTGFTRYPCLEVFDPADDMQKIASYSPESDQSYKLADKEMPINEAVAFFEEYVNSLPFPKEKNCRTVVRSVDVFNVTKDVYGYYFNTNKEYLGVQFDYMKDGTVHSGYDNYSPTIGSGFMVESDDVDIILGTYLLETVEDSTAYEQIVSFENAAEIIGSNLTDEVTFDAQMIELIYTTTPKKADNGYIDIDDPSEKIEPAWKFTLYNPQDQLVYVCFINAINGENFRYYKIYDSN